MSQDSIGARKSFVQAEAQRAILHELLSRSFCVIMASQCFRKPPIDHHINIDVMKFMMFSPSADRFRPLTSGRVKGWRQQGPPPGVGYARALPHLCRKCPGKRFRSGRT